MTTSSGFQIVFGAIGYAGTCEVRIETVFEDKLNPNAFLASTIN